MSCLSSGGGEGDGVKLGHKARPPCDRGSRMRVDICKWYFRGDLETISSPPASCGGKTQCFQQGLRKFPAEQDRYSKPEHDLFY